MSISNQRIFAGAALRIAIVSLALISASCVGWAAEQRFTDPQFGYSFVAPAGWSQKKDLPKPYVAFVGPVDDGFPTNVSFYTEQTANRSLAQYVKVAKETFAKSKTARLQSERRASVAGTPAVVLQSIVTLSGQPPTITQQVVVLHGGRGYTLTLAVAPSALKKYQPTFDKVVHSFRW